MIIQCVYKIKSKIDESRFYIGSSVNFKKRKSEHLRRLRNETHHSLFMQRHCNKYGIDDFIFEIIEIVEDVQKIISREQYYIDLLHPCFNSCKLAGNTLGYKQSEEVLAKLSKIRKGRKAWNKGIFGLIKDTEETKEKKRKALTGRPSPMKGRKHTEETKNKRRKPILQYDLKGNFLKEWDSAATAMISLGFRSNTINLCLTKKRKTAYKYKWEYKIL